MTPEPVPAPQPGLPPRPGDVTDTDAVKKLLDAVFADTKDKKTRDKKVERALPSVRLRRYRQGEEIYHQKDEGRTGFYAPTDGEVLLALEALRAKAADPQRQQALDQEIQTVKGRIAGGAGEDPASQGVVADITIELGRRRRSSDPESHQDHLREGEFVGELSCWKGTPRTATLTAARDAYLLEVGRDYLAIQYGEYVIQTRATLEEREGDISDHGVLQKVLSELSFFKGSKAIPSLEKYPGSVVIRRYHKGDVICRQGEAGWTAFVVLPRDDVLEVLEELILRETEPAQQRALDRELGEVRGQEGEPEPPVGEVRIDFQRPSTPERGVFGRLLDAVLGRKQPAPAPLPQTIPIDSFTDIPSDTRRVPLRVGELVGELSCLYGTPRSATIVAKRGCYALEMLRNCLEGLYGDPTIKERLNAVYRQRVLKTHLRGLELFRDLSDEVFEEVRDQVELPAFRDGDVICDEHDESDSMYVVRSGVVRVLKGASSLLRQEDVLDWQRLGLLLEAGKPPATGSGAEIWKRLLPLLT
jgi:CRP-like cAMP-binding protein